MIGTYLGRLFGLGSAVRRLRARLQRRGLAQCASAMGASISRRPGCSGMALLRGPSEGVFQGSERARALPRTGRPCPSVQSLAGAIAWQADLPGLCAILCTGGHCYSITWRLAQSGNCRRRVRTSGAYEGHHHRRGRRGDMLRTDIACRGGRSFPRQLPTCSSSLSAEPNSRYMTRTVSWRRNKPGNWA